MQRILLAFPNYSDAGTLSGGSWSSNAPLAKLQTDDIEDYARSADLLPASTLFRIDLGVKRELKFLALCNHNLTLSAQYRLVESSVSDFSVIDYDTGLLDVWDTVYPMSQRQWELENFWTGKLTSEEREGYPSDLPIILPGKWRRYVQVELFDPDNPAGYIQIGRLLAAGGFTPRYNYSYGASLRWVTRSKGERLESDLKKFDVKRPFREFAFSLEHIKEDEAYGRVLDMALRQDIHKQVYIMPDIDDRLNLQRRGFLATLTDLPAPRHLSYGRHSADFKYEEAT